MDINKEELKMMIDNMTWSYSRINAFRTCKYMWFLTYIKKFKGEQNAFSASGTFSHSILERYANGELYIWDLLDEFIDNYDEQVPYRFPPNRYVDLGDKNYNAGVEYFTSFEGFDDIGKIIGVELEVDTNLEDKKSNKKYKFTGFVDLLLEKDNEYIVLDHKSKGKFNSKREQSEYTRQLYVYAKYVKEKYGKFPKELIFNMFNAGEYIRIPFNLNDYNEAINWCVSTINEVYDELDFDKNVNDFFCSYLCNHSRTCERD